MPERRERVELLVERESIDRVDLGTRGVVIAVGLETEIVSQVNLVLLEVNVLNTASAFNGAYRITFSVGKALDAGCWAS